MKDIKKIFSFEDSLANVAAYVALGFDGKVDDVASDIFYVEADLTDYDWLATLGLLENCQKENLQPTLQHKGVHINWEDAIKYADLKASEELVDRA